jgi:hypothetical protein
MAIKLVVLPRRIQINIGLNNIESKIFKCIHLQPICWYLMSTNQHILKNHTESKKFLMLNKLKEEVTSFIQYREELQADPQKLSPQ